MADYLFTVPVVPGKLDAWKGYVREMTGPRRAEFEKSRTRLGLRDEQVFLQHTPNGDFCLVRWVADDIQRTFENMAKSNDPFDKWFRDKILVECHNVDFSKLPPMNERILDYHEMRAPEYADTRRSR